LKTLLSLIIVLALALPTWAAGLKSGTAGAQFLRIGVGSRYQGMADVGVATAGDAYAAYWNPAGLAEVDNWSLVFTNVNWLLDIDLNYFAAARRFEDVGVFATSVTVLSAGDQEITTTALDGQDGTGQYYSISSYAVGFSFARQLTHRFAFGASVKYLGEKIGEVDSRGLALDFGTLLYTGFNSLRVGMSITNMGPDMKFTGTGLKIGYDDQNGTANNTPVDGELSAQPYNLPLAFRIGLAYDLDFGPNSLVTVSAQLMDPNDGRQKATFGAEFGYQEKYFLRGGYKFQHSEETLALGAGMITPLSGDTHLVIDYAWQDFGRLESAQRFSIGFTF
jgi:hypothetical protein